MEPIGEKATFGSSFPIEQRKNLSGFNSGSFFEMDIDGNFIKVPSVLEEITGFSGDELDLLSLQNVTFTEDRELIASSIEAIMDGAPIVMADIELFSEAKGSHPIELILLPSIVDGEVQSIWGAIKDIARRKNLEKELQTTQEIQKASQRSLSDFVSLLTREIRQPLTTILLTLEMLDSGSFGELNETQGLRISQLIEVIDKLKTTLNEALDMSRNMDEQVMLDRRSVSLDKVIKSIVKSREKELEDAEIEMIVDLPANKVMAEIDRKAMMQVISTLLDRTISASPRSGQILLSLEDREKEVIFSISDSGEGIPEKDLVQLFEKMHMDHEKETMNFTEGLNLYIIKRIIERHGGRIWCESFVGIGSTYLFMIPKLQGKEA